MRTANAEQIQSQVVPSRSHSMADGSFKDVPEFFEVCILSSWLLFLDAHSFATGRTRGVDSRQD